MTIIINVQYFMCGVNQKFVCAVTIISLCAMTLQDCKTELFYTCFICMYYVQ